MKPLLAGVTALILALALVLAAPAIGARADSPGVNPQATVLPAAPQKTPKASRTPKPTPTAATPTPTARSAAEEEGDRWVQIAMIAGGGLLGSVAIFFGLGALLRRRPKRRR